MKIIVDITKSRIQTDNPELLEALYQLYSYKIPGSEYSAAYKSHRWDGKQHFISRSGIFRTGLLRSVVENLKKIECTPEVEYLYTKENSYNPYIIENFSFYEFQEELIKKALENQRGVIKAPTGSGKTLIMAALVKALAGKKTVILFNAKQLLKQTYEFLTEECNLDNIGLCFGEGYIYGDVMLCTVQSIEKILDTHLKETEVLMVDECHEFCKGKVTLPAIQSFPNAKYRFGFTATPPSENIAKYSLEGALGEILQVVKTSELIEQNKLSKPIIQLILILTKSLDHGRALENLLGGSCQFLEGANSIGERYKAISRFRGHTNSSVLIGTKILQTGINIEEITHFINARGMKSEIATLQALGRALRKHESKDKVYIYDFLDKEKYLREHSISRKGHYKREGHEIKVIK